MCETDQLQVRIRNLGDEIAVNALSQVTSRWMRCRGQEAFQAYYSVRNCLTSDEFLRLPSWMRDRPEVSPLAGDFARGMLIVLGDGRDPEVASWVNDAVQHADFEVLAGTLAIGGIILLGAILAARVKSVEWDEFEVQFGREWTGKDVAKAIRAGSEATKC